MIVGMENSTDTTADFEVSFLDMDTAPECPGCGSPIDRPAAGPICPVCGVRCCNSACLELHMVGCALDGGPLAAPAALVGMTVHIARGARYDGAWTLTEVGPADAAGWMAIRDGRCAWFVKAEHIFGTEELARAAAGRRRAPRRPRQPQPLYGDYAQLAAFHGIATDGTGRVLRGRKGGR